MKEMEIALSSISDVKNFVNTVADYDFEVDLLSGRYAVDAKSIIGIFSLDLTQPVRVRVLTDDYGDFFEKIQCFAAER